LEDKEIVGRAQAISDSYDKLLGEPKNLKQKIFDCLISTNITEGLAFYTSFACSFYFGYKGKMVGNADIIKLIHRDEALHVSITQNIVKQLAENPGEGFQDIVKANKQKVLDMYGLAAENEKKWAAYLFSKGSLMGLNTDLLNGYIEWLANNRLTSLGYDKIFDAKKNPISGWLDSYLDNKRVQVAPQESEKTEYRIGSRNTEVDKAAFKKMEL
jgi:ribonucleoside-diphosphate reductase beta chain